MSSNEITILTERLVLRRIRSSDAKEIFKYRANPLINEFQGWKPQTLDEVEEFIHDKIAQIPNIPGTWYQLAIVNKATDELLGDVGIHFIDSDDSQAEIGFTLSSAHQGKGYATEAVAGVVNYLFRDLRKHRIIASVDPRNTKSIALLERLPMRKEAHFRKSYWNSIEWTDDVVYAILEEEWIR